MLFAALWLAALAICPAVLAEQRQVGSAVRVGPAAHAVVPMEEQRTRLDYAAIEPGLGIALRPPASERLTVPPNMGGPARVGFHRELPAHFRGDLTQRLGWTALSNGEVVGSLTVASPGAVAIRVALTAQLPPRGEIRFFNPTEPGHPFHVTTAEDFHRLPDGELDPLWSPVVQGDAIGIETTLPSLDARAGLALRLHKVSHRNVRVGDRAVAASALCAGHVDVQCRVGSFPDGMQDAVANIVIERGDGAYNCSATLLNNARQDRLPYLLTANHCVSTPAEARSIVATWFHEYSSCGGVEGNGLRASGRSRLLATSVDQDATLLRVMDRVPSDVLYAGWSPFPLTHPTAVYGIHHPGGDYKKYSAGVTVGNDIFLATLNAIRVEWHEGLTEGGSSGSGLFTDQYLVGVLSGGSEGCDRVSNYGNFADFFPKACPWLTPDDLCQGRNIPLFLSAENPARQGFARIVNHSDWAGVVNIFAIDDTGTRFGPVPLEIGARRTIHFNSDDLERSNPAKGLVRGVGVGQGDWRLLLDSDLNIEALAYVRTADGFVTTMHDLVPSLATATSHRYQVPFFNPGSNRNQVSKLRLANPSAGVAAVYISGRDDSGFAPPAVSLNLHPGTVRTITAHQLERGEGLRGGLGDRVGKWSLSLESDVDIQVMNLLESPTGHLANLSSFDGDSELIPEGLVVLPLFLPASNASRQGFARVSNLSGERGTVDIHGIDERGRLFGPIQLVLNPRQTCISTRRTWSAAILPRALPGSATARAIGGWR